MALRGPAGAFSLRVGTDKDAQAIKMLQYAAPWLLWILGLPVAAFALRMARRFWGHPTMLAVGMDAATVLLTVLIWKVTSGRGMDRIHHMVNMVACMGWLSAVVAAGPNGALGIVYLVGGLTGCVAWNVRYTKHMDKVLDAIPATTKTNKQPVIDMGYVARALAQKAPVVRTALEGAGNVVPALKSPWAPAGELTAGAQPGIGKAADGTVDQNLGGVVLQSKVVGVDPKPVWERISRNWKVFTTQRQAGRELNGARLVPLALTPTRIKTKVVLKRGDQLPKSVEGAREHLCVMNGLRLDQVQVLRGNGLHGEVLVDWIICDTLSETMEWQGIDGEWRSITDGPLVFGQREDGSLMEWFQPALPAKGINLAHLAMEGMNGSGKSNVSRLAIAQGVRIYDVVDWAADPKKATQTLGSVANALDWLAPTEREAVGQFEFTVDYVTARAEYLGNNGYDEWEPGCGLPFHRIWLQEGNLTADLLGEDAEKIGNLARSTGVALNGEFQRMHHNSVSTGLRAVFADMMCYGVSSPGDSFLLPDELAQAGADPSIWKNKKAGMLYWASRLEDVEKWIIPGRSFRAGVKVAAEVCDTYGEEKHERIKREFPDWIALLKKLDVNDVYANRTTGPAKRRTILEAQAKRNGQKSRTTEPVPSPRDPEPEDDITPTTENEDSPMGTSDDQPADYDMYKDPKYLEGLKREQPGAAALTRSAEAMGMDPSWFESVQDASLDDEEIPFPHPDRVLVFGQPPMPDKAHDKAKSMAHLLAYLAGPDMGPGKKFRPHEVAAECMPITGKTAQWYRGVLSGELASMGVVEWNKEKGEYRVSRDILNEDVRQRVEAQIKAMVDA